jgi:protein-L-isoaspartate O-methyltransferase
MLQMLELQPGMTIADLGSGCGITAIAFSVFGCASVLGFEVHEYSCEVANEMAETIRVAAAAEGREQVTVPTFITAAVNERLRGGGEMMFDRLHGGYMMNQENASRYAREHLNPNGIAVMNVGSGNNGAVMIFRKDAAGIVSSEDSGIKVVFQEDLRPAAEVELIQRVVSAGTEARLQTVERDLIDLERDVQRYVLISGACAQAHGLASFLLSPHPRSHVLQAAR